MPGTRTVSVGSTYCSTYAASGADRLGLDGRWSGDLGGLGWSWMIGIVSDEESVPVDVLVGFLLLISLGSEALGIDCSFEYHSVPGFILCPVYSISSQYLCGHTAKDTHRYRTCFFVGGVSYRTRPSKNK